MVYGISLCCVEIMQPRNLVSLFGGSITCELPSDFADASKFRDVPDHQEVFVDLKDPERSLIIEIVDSEKSVEDTSAAEFFFKDYVEATGASRYNILSSEIHQLNGIVSSNPQISCTVVFVQGTMEASKLGDNVLNNVAVTLAIHRLHHFQSEIIFTLHSNFESLADSIDLVKTLSNSFKIKDTLLFK